jgi:hypothetical protein
VAAAVAAEAAAVAEAAAAVGGSEDGNVGVLNVSEGEAQHFGVRCLVSALVFEGSRRYQSGDKAPHSKVRRFALRDTEDTEGGIEKDSKPSSR